MRCNSPVFIYIFLSAFLFSCQNKPVDDLLHEAEDIITTRLDSANLILDKISNPGQLKGSQQTEYCRMKAVCIAYIQMDWKTADSLNTIATNYYRQINDTSRLLETLYFSGYVNQNLGRNDVAAERYLEMNKLASDCNNPRIKASARYTASQFYLSIKDYDKALLFAKDAFSSLDQSDTITGCYYSKQLASIYARINQVDSAMIYYDKAMEKILKYGAHQRLTSLILSEIAELQLSNNDYKKALDFIEQSLIYRSDRRDIALFNLAKARIFLGLNETDSARMYLKRTIESSEDNNIALLAYRHLADLYANTGNYSQAFYKLLNHQTFFERQMSDIDSEILRKKYTEEKLKNENNELKLAKKEREILLLTIALCSTILSIVLWYIFLREKKKKRIREQLQKEQVLKDQAKIAAHEYRLLKQDSELGQLREKAAVLRESLFRKMSVSWKIPSLDITGIHSKEAPSKRISLEKAEWDELIQTVNDTYNGFTSRLKKDYPELTHDDIGFCCLLKINVSMQDLADIYCISKAGITKRKTRMKKEKFKIEDDSLTLDDFLAGL